MAANDLVSTFEPNISTNNVCNVYEHRNSARIGLPLHYSLILIFGALANALALTVICQNRKKINSATLYSANLVISDILFTTALPTRIVYYALGFDWLFGEVLCRITSAAFYINTYAGVNFTMFLSIDRCIAVVYPFHYNKLRKSSYAKYVCFFIWSFVFLQTLPLLILKMTRDEGGHTTCMEYPNFEVLPHLPFMLLGACFIGYIFPLCIILCCYVRISNKLCQNAKENPLTEKSGSNQKAINTIILIIVVYLLCFTPYHVAIIQHMVKKLQYDPSCTELQHFQISLHVTVCLMNLNSCLDPFIYFFACRGYKNRVMKLLRRQVSISTSSATRPAVDESSRSATENQMMMVPSNGSRR